MNGYKKFEKKELKLRLLCETKLGWKRIGYLKIDLSEPVNLKSYLTESTSKFSECLDKRAKLTYSITYQQILDGSRPSTSNYLRTETSALS